VTEAMVVLERFQVQMKNRKLSVWGKPMEMNKDKDNRGRSFDLFEGEEEEVCVRILILRMRMETKTKGSHEMTWSLKMRKTHDIWLPQRRLGCEMMMFKVPLVHLHRNGMLTLVVVVVNLSLMI